MISWVVFFYRKLVVIPLFLVVSFLVVGFDVFLLTRMEKKGVILAGSQGVTLGENDEREVVEAEGVVISADARPVIIEKYLKKYKSPLVPYSGLIYEVSQDYGFEYYWIVAIAQQESNLCKKIPENSHNCWGYGINSRGTLKFPDYETAIKSFAEYLKREYFDKGYNTAELIMKKYCPHSNGSWAYGVNQFIDELENGKI